MSKSSVKTTNKGSVKSSQRNSQSSQSSQSSQKFTPLIGYILAPDGKLREIRGKSNSDAQTQRLIQEAFSQSKSGLISMPLKYKFIIVDIAKRDGINDFNVNDNASVNKYLKHLIVTQSLGLVNLDVLQNILTTKSNGNFSQLWKNILNELSPRKLVTDEDYARFMNDINATEELTINSSPSLINDPQHRIPDEIGQLNKLKKLKITNSKLNDYGNVLTKIYPWDLELFNNDFTTLPTNIPNTIFMNLSGNNLTELDPNILKTYKSMKYLFLSDNHITNLPQLPSSLELLYIDNNNISTISSNLPKNLNELAIYENPIERLPLKVCRRLENGPKQLHLPLADKLIDRCKADIFQDDISYMSGAIKLHPGSRWIQGVHGFDHLTPKEIYELVVRDINRPNKKLQNQEWKVICSQLGEMRKDELIDILLDMGLEGYVRNRMSKKELCDIARKYLQSFQSDLPTYSGSN